MQLSKKERKYRIRLIQENQFDKREQRKLDIAHISLSKPYAKIYRLEHNGYTHLFMAEIFTARMSKAMSVAGISAEVLSKSFCVMTAAFQTANTAGGKTIYDT